MKDIALVFLGDNYVVAQWQPKNMDMQCIAMFRDLSDDNITNFVVTQVRGPWTGIDADGRLKFDNTFDDLFVQVYQKALTMKDDLNNDREIEWRGDIYTY